MLQLDEAISALNVESVHLVPHSLAVCRKNPRCSENLLIHFFITIGGGSYAGRICGSGPAVFVHLAETLVSPNHPLRRIRALVCDVLGELNRSFGKLYSNEGCPSIPPEQLLCRRSTAFGRNDSLWSNWTTIACTGGSWGCRRSGLGPDQLHEEP
jgi:hypothetical protein